MPYLRRNIGTVFQDYKLLTDKTVFENVAFGLEVIGKPKHVIDQRVPEILDYVGLGDKLNSFPDELSGGEQQRVSIARACVNRPLVLLADEPTGNLDPNTSVDIMRLLDKVNRIGTTVVMATHDQAIVDAMRKRVVELDKGQVVRDQARGVYGYGAGVQGYFRETASGLRRNGIVAFAAMSTAFIALFLFGLALLIAREFNLVIDAWTGNVQVARLPQRLRERRHRQPPHDQARGASGGRRGHLREQP